MELNSRKGDDRFVRPGSYQELADRLRRWERDWANVPAVVLSCFEHSTRMLPFVIYDKYIFPAGARAIAGCLHEAGFRNVRAVFQLWNPNFRPSAARLDGRRPQILLLSTMWMHSPQAIRAIRDAWTLGDERPLILVGGPKAWYQPYDLWPIEDSHGRRIGPDAVVTGEQFVLLDLLNAVTDYYRRGEPFRQAFERARMAGALDNVPGLVYLAPEADFQDPSLIDTGLQRLLQCFDELPSEAVGLGLMEPAHRRAGLSAAPIPPRAVRKHSRITSFVLTQGCKFSCSYCPIPGLNQRSWRYRTPESAARVIREVYEKYRIKYFFGADDNFFNHRPTSEAILEALAREPTARGRTLGKKIRWATEATQFDTFKNRDLLPLARRAGLQAIWFGIEDLTAELINKGQKPEVTIELFKLMHAQKMLPMAMMMFHEGQPFYSPGDLYGLANQVEFLRKAGAVSVQLTVHTPAPGTREFDRTYASGQVIQRLGDFEIPPTHTDGNHVIVDGATPAWKRQLQLLAGYASFYNPLNLLRAFKKDGSPLRKYRIGYQLAGMYGTAVTGLRMIPYIVRLLFSKAKHHAAPPPQATVPVRYAEPAHPRLPESVDLLEVGVRSVNRERETAQSAA